MLYLRSRSYSILLVIDFSYFLFRCQIYLMIINRRHLNVVNFVFVLVILPPSRYYSIFIGNSIWLNNFPLVFYKLIFNQLLLKIVYFTDIWSFSLFIWNQWSLLIFKLFNILKLFRIFYWTTLTSLSCRFSPCNIT